MDHLLQGGVERPLRKPWLQRQAQVFAPDALKVRVFRVVGSNPHNRFRRERAPLLLRESQSRIPCFEDDEAEGRREFICAHGGESVVAREDAELGDERRRGQERGEDCERIADRKRRALRLPFWRAPLARRRPQVEENASAERTLGGYVADDIAIHGGRGDRPIEDELNIRLLARSNGLAAKQDNARANLRRRVMKADRKPLVDRLLFAGQEPQAGVDAIRRRMEAGVEHEITAANRILLDARTCEVERAAIARLGDLRCFVLRMQRSNARRQPGRADLDLSPTRTDPE